MPVTAATLSFREAACNPDLPRARPRCQLPGVHWVVEKRAGVVMVTVAANAGAVRDAVREALSLVTHDAGLVVDLRAVSSWSPIEHKALVDIASAFDVARRPVAVVAHDSSRRAASAFVDEAAPRLGTLCATIDEAVARAAGA
jgi:hypothetical protein